MTILPLPPEPVTGPPPVCPFKEHGQMLHLVTTDTCERFRCRIPSCSCAIERDIKPTTEKPTP